MPDAIAVDSLLSEWLDWKPAQGRLDSVQRAIGNRELLVAAVHSEVVGFIHYVMHEDVIDGDPNSFITAFYVTEAHRGKGIGTQLLEECIRDSLRKGAVGVETSTIHVLAKRFYEKRHFRQTIGEIGEVFLELDLPAYLKIRRLSAHGG